MSVSQLCLPLLRGSPSASVGKVALRQTGKRACAHRHGLLAKLTGSGCRRVPEPLTAKTCAESTAPSRCLLAS